MIESTQDIKEFSQRLKSDGGTHTPIRAKTMIATIFGDLISAHGNRIWLSELIQLADEFNINERQVRTSVFRLVEEGWLTKKRHGRRSTYGLSEEGLEQTALAQKLLYYYQPKPWNGSWDLVIATSADISISQHLQLRRRLTLMGFGMLSKNIYGHPDMDNALVTTAIQELGLEDKVFVMVSTTSSNEDMIRQCCNYEDTEKSYRQFTEVYQEVPDIISNSVPVSESDCYCVQMFLMHDYRRILFKDPQLPDELLPDNWIGTKAREIVRSIYRQTFEGTNKFYQSQCNTGDLKPVVDESFFSRFGGLS